MTDVRWLSESKTPANVCQRDSDRLNFVRRDVAYLNDLMHDLGMR